MTYRHQPDRIPPAAITLEFLTALAELTQGERTAWIDRHILGTHLGNSTRKVQATTANRKLRKILGTPDRLRNAA
jgi:hypothetical protein